MKNTLIMQVFCPRMLDHCRKNHTRFYKHKDLILKIKTIFLIKNISVEMRKSMKYINTDRSVKIKIRFNTTKESSMAPKIVDREAKKEQIVHAAIGVFAEKGVANTKMIDIARAAAIGKGTIYEYFRSKEDIFAAAYNRMNREMEMKIGQILSGSEHPAVQLQMIFDLSLDYFGHDAVEFSAVMMDFWAEGIRRKSPEMMGVINLKEIYDQYREIIAGIVRNGQRQGLFIDVDPVSYASLAIGALDGMLLQMVMSAEIIDIARVKETFKRTMIQCLQKEKPNTINPETKK